MDAVQLAEEVAKLAEKGKSLDYVLAEAKRCVAFLQDEKALKRAYDHGKARALAMETATKAMQAACPHPMELHRERPGGIDRSGVAWGTDASCGACGKDLGSVH